MDKTISVITYAEIVDQAQVNELTELLAKGYTNHHNLGAGLILLSNHTEEIGMADEQTLVNLFRGKLIKSGKKDIELISGVNVEVHICTIDA